MIARYIGYNGNTFVQKKSVELDGHIYFLYGHTKKGTFPANTSLAVDEKGKILSSKVETLEDVEKVAKNFTQELQHLNQEDRLILDITGKTKKDFTQEVLGVFEKGITEVYNSNRWMNWLEFCTSFRNYSSRNRMLIYMQMPYATHVASMKDWNTKYKRSVIAGQGAKGLKIFAPTTFKQEQKVYKKDKNGNILVGEDGQKEIDVEYKKIQGYVPVSVYDISQTKGEPVPTLTEELKGNYNDKGKVLKALENIAGCKITFGNIEGSAKGFFRESVDGLKQIVLREGMDDTQIIKTAVHETAHAVLHSVKDNGFSKIANMTRQEKELQAESVAYQVCKHLGIDSSNYTFPYLASWSRGKDIKVLKENIDVIVKTADDFIKKLDVLMLKIDLSKAKNPSLLSEYLQHSEYLNDVVSPYNNLSFEDKVKTLNQNLSKIDKLGADNIIVEICWSENSKFNQGELYTLEQIDSMFEHIDQSTRQELINKNLEGMYTKVMFKVYIQDKYPDLDTGKKYASHIRERYDFGDCIKNSLTDYLASYNTYKMLMYEYLENRNLELERTQKR